MTSITTKKDNVFRFGGILINQIRQMEVLLGAEANITRGYGLRVCFSIAIIVAADALCGKA